MIWMWEMYLQYISHEKYCLLTYFFLYSAYRIKVKMSTVYCTYKTGPKGTARAQRMYSRPANNTVFPWIEDALEYKTQSIQIGFNIRRPWI